MAQMQYKTGTVTVTNGDATVTGLGTLFVANIAAGAIFKVDGDTATYVVGSITSDTALELTANYTGTTGGSKTYAIHRDFSVNRGYAMPNKGEAEFPDILREQVIKKIDEDMATKAPLVSPTFTTKITTPQVAFPATQSASSDANTLDDYEEGTWTPTLLSGTCSSANMTYTKIGRQVTVAGQIDHTGNGSGTTPVTITSLPFVVASAVIGSAMWVGIALDGTDTACVPICSAGTSSLAFLSSPSGSGVDASRWLAGAMFIFAATYNV